MSTERTTKEIYIELDFVTDRISTQIRTLALGVLAIVWLFLAGLKDAPTLRLASSTRPLVGIGALCILGLLLDYVQYLFGYWATHAALARAEGSESQTATYNYENWRWRCRIGCFRLKQFATVGACLWLMILIGRALW